MPNAKSIETLRERERERESYNLIKNVTLKGTLTQVSL